jgi:hypothetical protein
MLSLFSFTNQNPILDKLDINPGSAGPRRFQLPVTLARLDIGQTQWKVDFIDLRGTKDK